MRSSLGLRGLRSPSELHLYAPVGKPTSSPGIGPVRVTWRTSLSDTCSSVPFRPSIDMLSGVHSRVDVATASSDSNQPDSNHVPTAWFRTTSPVCSAVHPVTGAAANPPLLTIPLRVAGLLHPAANRGVHRVSQWLLLLPGLAAVLAMLLPLEGFPPSSAVPCHHGPCPPAVPSLRCSDLAGSRFRSHRSIRIPP
jgi:hypothetical protein